MLFRVFTQNIDGLELKADVSLEKCVFAHGTLTSAACSGCKEDYPIDKLKDYIKEKKVVYCDICASPIKPNVILYGENLPSTALSKFLDIAKADICFIIGTSLKVMPFNQLPYNTSSDCYRVLINLEIVGQQSKKGFNFADCSSKDLFLEGKCDDVMTQIIKDLEWNI